MELAIVGIILALAVGLGYTLVRWAGARNEKATLEAQSKVADKKIEVLEAQSLREEAAKRNQEKAEENEHEDNLERTGALFYPGRVPDKNGPN